MAFWDFFKLFAYAYFRPRNKDMGATSVTGIGSGRKMLQSIGDIHNRAKTILFLEVDDEEEAKKLIRHEMMFSFDYIMTRSGKVIKSRDGDLPPVVARDPHPAPKSKYRSIDDA